MEREEAVQLLRSIRTGLGTTFVNLLKDVIYNEYIEREIDLGSGRYCKLVIDFTRFPDRIEVRIG